MSYKLVHEASAILKYIGMVEDDTSPLLSDIPILMSLEYQKNLLNKIISGRLWDEKAYRSIGWIKASLVINGIGDHNVYTMINYCCNLKK